MKMRWHVVIIEHADKNPLELGNDRHLFVLARVAAHAVLDVVVDDEVQLLVREAAMLHQSHGCSRHPRVGGLSTYYGIFYRSGIFHSFGSVEYLQTDDVA